MSYLFVSVCLKCGSPFFFSVQLSPDPFSSTQLRASDVTIRDDARVAAFYDVSFPPSHHLPFVHRYLWSSSCMTLVSFFLFPRYGCELAVTIYRSYPIPFPMPFSAFPLLFTTLLFPSSHFTILHLGPLLFTLFLPSHVFKFRHSYNSLPSGLGKVGWKGKEGVYTDNVRVVQCK